MNNNPYNEKYYMEYGYDKEPYETSDGIFAVMEAIVVNVVSICKPKLLLDVGCALGWVVKLAYERYNIDAIGIDISEWAIEHSVIPERVIQHDITEPLVFLHKDVDMIVCIEVLEHIPQEKEADALDNICNLAKEYIYFSSCPPEEDVHDDDTHVNVQPTEHWHEEFAKRGFHPYPYLQNSPVGWATLYIHEDLLQS